MPETDIQPVADTELEHGLDEDFDFTGTKDASYTLLGFKHYHKTWKDTAETIPREMYNFKPTIMMLFSEREEYPGNYFTSEKQNNIPINSEAP